MLASRRERIKGHFVFLSFTTMIHSYRITAPLIFFCLFLSSLFSIWRVTFLLLSFFSFIPFLFCTYKTTCLLIPMSCHIVSCTHTKLVKIANIPLYQSSQPDKIKIFNKAVATTRTSQMCKKSNKSTPQVFKSRLWLG